MRYRPQYLLFPTAIVVEVNIGGKASPFGIYTKNILQLFVLNRLQSLPLTPVLKPTSKYSQIFQRKYYHRLLTTIKSSVQAVPTCDWGAVCPAGLVLKIDELFIESKNKAYEVKLQFLER